ncbi:hypothetical protein [Paenibacillus validus]|uniref:DUF4013 domain-containing protein n=1 Tax=Paenibacillus validus TaxID=44253 RepID=A0A7X3CW61_9BACL|nr:hypothetical protein [Paenibacillus validus]MUG73824.1 hypothetical protein [Paenibacillus validus]
MWNRVKSGWSIAWGQPFAVFTLFVYHLAWGIALYKLVQSVVLPLLHRYPTELSKEAVQLFWIESQFQLMKTNLIEPFLWWGLALLALRMLLHPLLNAGVYYSLQNRDMNAGYRFVEGIRRLTLPYFGFYAAQLLLTLAPLVWLVPLATELFGSQVSYSGLVRALLPALSAFAVYLLLIQLVFMYLQIGKASGRSMLFTCLFIVRHLPAIVLAALTVLGLGLLATAAVMAASFFWAGFLALLAVQVFRLAQMFFKVWAIGTQFALWTEKA